METLDAEYRHERDALPRRADRRRSRNGAKPRTSLETRGDKEYAELIDKFELRQVALALDEGRAARRRNGRNGAGARAKGGYRGVPMPWRRSGKARGRDRSPAARRTRSARLPIIDRHFRGQRRGTHGRVR